MKPETPNDERELDARLARALRRSADYIDDDGFSDRVMQSLSMPAPSRRSVGVRLWVLLAAILVGSLAVAVIPAQAWAYTLAAGILAMPLDAMLQTGALITLVLMAALGGWALQED